MSDFPRMLYRDGSEYDVNGEHVDTLIVEDAVEMVEALRSGWRVSVVEHSLDHDGDGLPGGSRPRRGRPPRLRDVD